MVRMIARFAFNHLHWVLTGDDETASRAQGSEKRLSIGFPHIEVRKRAGVDENGNVILVYRLQFHLGTEAGGGRDRKTGCDRCQSPFSRCLHQFAPDDIRRTQVKPAGARPWAIMEVLRTVHAYLGKSDGTNRRARDDCDLRPCSSPVWSEEASGIRAH